MTRGDYEAGINGIPFPAQGTVKMAQLTASRSPLLQGEYQVQGHERRQKGGGVKLLLGLGLGSGLGSGFVVGIKVDC